jgi:hypothetical protein
MSTQKQPKGYFVFKFFLIFFTVFAAHLEIVAY